MWRGRGRVGSGRRSTATFKGVLAELAVEEE